MLPAVAYTRNRARAEQARARLLAALDDLTRREGRPPSIREIGLHLSLSPRQVTYHAHLAEALGLLEIRPGARGMRLTDRGFTRIRRAVRG